MRVFNRVFMILLFAGLFVLGVYMIVFAFDLFDYKLESLPITDLAKGLEDFVSGVEKGSLSATTIIILVLLAILGLIWFIAELRPTAPRRVRMGSGTYVTRSVVQDEVSTVAEQVPDDEIEGMHTRRARLARLYNRVATSPLVRWPLLCVGPFFRYTGTARARTQRDVQAT